MNDSDYLVNRGKSKEKVNLFFKSKKAVSFKILNMTFFRIFFITLAFFVVWLFTVSQIQDNIDIHDIRNDILVGRAFYSPSSFSYVDEDAGRVFPGIIDIDRFNDVVMNDSFGYDVGDIAARFELRYIDSDYEKNTYINKKWYDRWEPLTKFEQYSQDTSWRYVLVKDDDKIHKAVLRIDVVASNE